jgi:hypothetical protein
VVLRVALPALSCFAHMLFNNVCHKSSSTHAKRSNQLFF